MVALDPTGQSATTGQPGARTGSPARRQRRPGLGRAITLLLCGIYFIGPLLAAFWFSIEDKVHGGVQFSAYAHVFSAVGFTDAFTLSLKLGIGTVVISLLLMVPTMLLLHLRAPGFRPLVETLCLMPLVIPPVVLVAGVSVVLSWGPNQLAGTPFQTFLNAIQSGSTPWVLILEYVILTLPFTYRALDAGIRSVDVHTLTEAGRNLGAGWITVTVRILLPSLRTAVLNAAFLAFALVFGEYTIASILQYTPFAVFIVAAGQTEGQLSTSLSLLSLLITWILLLLISLLGGRNTRKVQA
ncbi:MAG: ABC transporter permease subunit [Jatrophihabitantaceae bacterium]